jgi:hypothetical protein
MKSFPEGREKKASSGHLYPLGGFFTSDDLEG